MARPGMMTMIATLRSLCNATTSDATIGTETYFTDDHLQQILDSTQRLWSDVPLQPVPDVVDGALVYLTYQIPPYIPRVFEEQGSSSGWAMRTTNGTLVDPSTYSVNYESGTLTFNADTNGASYVLDCRTYNINRAASNVWLRKASFAYQDVDWGSDNHTLRASQQFNHALHMAERYALLAGGSSGRFVRPDEVVLYDGIE